jgi:hypothetical protein
VYFVAVRTTSDRGGAEIQHALSALKDAGLLPDPPADGHPHAVAWFRPYEEMTANDHHALRQLGLEFDDANRIATVASVATA